MAARRPRPGRLGRAAVFLIGLIGSGRAEPARAGPMPEPKPVRCAQVDMQADAADCDADACRLRNHARIACGNLLLYADAIDIAFDAQHRFAGAHAVGHTTLVQDTMVATCTRVDLAADQITGTVSGATIALRAPGARPDAAGIPQGRNATVVHGDIERTAPDRFVARGGDFTACDCGPDADPSWRLAARTVEVEVGERAVIWGPQLYINPLSLGLVPVTPPLLPLSLPLRKRAPGFLPPLPRKYAGAWPAVDLPFFVPLGESYDVTVFLGLRPDWRAAQSPAGSIHYWGAPRAGMRFRYAPTEGTQGQASIEITRDGARGMAAQVLAAEGLTGVPLSPDQALLDARRRALVNRVVVNARHQSRLGPRVDWLADLHWRSDDLIPKDFALDVGERFATYMPSRTQLTWRNTRATAVASADWLLRLDNLALSPQGTPLPVYSNTDGTESGTMHRGPYLAWQWLPQPLGLGFTWDAGLNVVRLGTWSQTAPAPSLSPTFPTLRNQGLAGLTGGLAWQRPLGPVRLVARVGADGLLTAEQEARARLDLAVTADATADVRLARRFGSWLHMVNPTLQYRGLVARPVATDTAVDMLHALDARAVRRLAQQLRLKLRQHLRHAASGMVADVELAQPLDLRTGAWLSPWATAAWGHPRYGSASLRLSFDYRYLHRLPLREVAAAYNVAVGIVRLSAMYDRLAPDADRFVRTLYELAAPRPAVTTYDSTAPWVHVIRAGVGVALPLGFGAGYTAQYQLPPPDGSVSPCAAAGPDRADAGCFIQHAVTLQYTSPCNCWGVGGMLTVVPLDPINTTRFNVTFSVADTVVSMDPASY